ncbi:MAG: hypothetical protein ACT4OZ_04405 [Gemmatimonadota bacterium]
MAASEASGSSEPATGTAQVELPSWSIVSERRRAHIARVCRLLDSWALELGLRSAERQEWWDAGRWHDALRDAPLDQLRKIVSDDSVGEHALHGHAAARLLERDGESRTGVLEAVRWHTTGVMGWGRTGKALYMADFLEPGRAFATAETRSLAALVPAGFESTYRRVVELRRERAGRTTSIVRPRASPEEREG